MRAVLILVLGVLGLLAVDPGVEARGFELHTAGSAARLESTRARAAGADVFSDDFQRGALGSNWKVYFGTPGIIGGSDLGLLSGTFALLSWAASVPADQFSEAQIALDAGTAEKGVFVRRRASDGARYQFHYDTNGTDADPRPQWQIKYDGVPTPQTRVLATNFSAPAPVPGDVLRIEGQGENLRGYVNGRLILSAKDGALTSGGVGVALLKVGGVAAPTPIFGRWVGGRLPRILELRRSGALVLSATLRRCFSITSVANTRSQYTFRVTDLRTRVVWKDVRTVDGDRPTIVKWCGRRTAIASTPRKALSPGRYRATLAVSAVPEGPRVLIPFFSRTWLLQLRK